ncbi:CRISPR-associated endonuclease Cas1 [Methanosarcina sp. UBA411]|uniref:CRISPR-associated endonuclease Cas1 n=1 Tax=Methanosarcina sp. UBA411 TaxID=1915589 RepID=UPI0025EC9C6B|nr:CRISPR-associated endonuclease Cas1 [Methanosarcina sp. UBA411]
MKLLLLNGYGIDMRVDGGKLHIKEGRSSPDEEPEEYIFAPKRIDIDSIVIYGRKGNLTLDSIRWLIKHNVQISILNWDGKLLTTMLPPESTNVKTKFAQYHAFEDQEKRVEIAKKFIEAKFNKSQAVVDYLKLMHPEIHFDVSDELKKLEEVKTIKELMGIEGGLAWKYWNEFSKAIPEKYEFCSRIDQYRRPMGSGDMMNTMLNYGYALLEAECLRAINTVGLDPHVGFLHEMNPSKNSLAYDLQEPFRFLVDLAVINLIENNIMEKKDFVVTENYNLRLKGPGAKKIVNEFSNMLNKTVGYGDKQTTWWSVLLLKTRELSHYLTEKSKKLEFVNPEFGVFRVDSQELRQKILNISYVDWKKLGFSKGTLHYMKQNAKSDKPFTLNSHVLERVKDWENLVSGSQVKI